MNGLHGIIFAYEKAPGLRELTEARMPGSVPFGGRYRVVDFMLSNMAGAGKMCIRDRLQPQVEHGLDERHVPLFEA